MNITFRKALCFALPRSVWLRRRTRQGVIATGKNRRGYGGRGFFVFGERLERELDHLHEFIGNGGTFVDIGANVGVFSLKAAHCVGADGIVVSVEPLPERIHALRRNVLLNGFSNVRIRNFCCTDRTEAVDLWINFSQPNATSVLQRDQRARKVSAFGVILDDLVEWEKLPGLDYLKVDAESAESLICRAARRQSAGFVPSSRLRPPWRRLNCPRIMKPGATRKAPMNFWFRPIMASSTV
jgi:FkbM family methyltransferase